MKYDRKIKSIIRDIKDFSASYLNYVESSNECATTDRIIEVIIQKSKELENYHEIRFEQDNNEKMDNRFSKLDIPIKNWYTKEYPSDKLGKFLSPSATFLDLNNLLNSHNENQLYDLLGCESDTIIRERCFQKLAELTNQDYNILYDKWINNHKDLDQEEELENDI